MICEGARVVWLPPNKQMRSYELPALLYSTSSVTAVGLPAQLVAVERHSCLWGFQQQLGCFAKGLPPLFLPSGGHNSSACPLGWAHTKLGNTAPFTSSSFQHFPFPILWVSSTFLNSDFAPDVRTGSKLHPLSNTCSINASITFPAHRRI